MGWGGQVEELQIMIGFHSQAMAQNCLLLPFCDVTLIGNVINAAFIIFLISVRVNADLIVKIGDFGRSRDLEGNYDYISQDKKAKLPVKWMAPESLERRLYNEKTDVV